MNYKKLNEIKAGKAVYKHDGTLEQLHEVEMYCQGADSPKMKNAALYYGMGRKGGFCAIRPPHSSRTVYGSKDIFTEYHYFDKDAPVWIWNNGPRLRMKAYYKDTEENSKWPYLVDIKNGLFDCYKNIAPRVEEVEDTPECKKEAEQSTPKQPERKVKSVKTCTITLTEYEDEKIDLNCDFDGLNYFEMIGVLKKVSELVEGDLMGLKKSSG